MDAILKSKKWVNVFAHISINKKHKFIDNSSLATRPFIQDSKAVLSDLTKSPVHEATASTTTGTSVTTSNGSNGSLGVHVLSASGKNIIAVANPALALSPTLVEPLTIKRENITMDEWWWFGPLVSVSLYSTNIRNLS